MPAIVQNSPVAAHERVSLPYVKSFAWQAYLPIEHGIADASRQQIDQVYCDLSSYEDAPARWSRDKVERVNELQAANGVRVIGHSDYRLPLASEIPEVVAGARAANRREIDLCATLGAPLIVHGGPGAETRLVREARPRCLKVLAESLAAAQRYARDHGVQLILENLSNHRRHPFTYFGTITDEIEQLLDAAPGLMALIDVGHANVNGGDPVAMFTRLASRVWGLSLSNNGGVHDSHAPLDQGTIDFLSLRAAFEDARWLGAIAFETRGSDFAANRAFLEALEALHDMRPGHPQA